MPSQRSNRYFHQSAAAIGSALFALSMTVGMAEAVEKRCDWHGPLSGGEKPYAKCVDFAALNGKTMDLPKNVTRISADGLSFCQPATPTTGAGNADIVFVYDNSGSMTADAIYINPATNDSSFHYIDQSRGCLNDIVTPHQDVTYPGKEGPWTVLAMSGEAGCTGNIAGDPYNARGFVIKAGIDFLASSSPTSTAGAISFNSQIEYPQPPLQMNVAGNVATVKNSIKLDTSGGTIYRLPLQQAKTWLNDANLIKTQKQAIIFISDGAPNDNNYLDLVDSRMPPIYSIFLSKDVTPDTANLKELSDRTGGTFSRVNPNDPGAMEALLKSIIKTITANTLPKAATITNKSLAPPQTSKSTGVVSNPDGSAGMMLDSIIALKLGANQIEIQLTREDNSNVTYSFTMNVAGGEISSSSGNYSCWDMPTLTAIDKKTNTPPEIYRPDNTSYQLKLTRSPSDLKDVTVVGTSANNDKENIGLSNLNNNLGYPTQTGDFTYNPAKPNPSLNNGVLEVDGKGDLTFVWTHPRDARETVTYILPGRVVPVLDGDVDLHIKDPVTQGVTFDPGSIKDPVVVVDSKDHCILNCTGTESFHTSNGVPTWNIVIKSPFRYSIRLFDNLGQFVSNSDGEMTAAEWASLSKSGDSASIQIKIIPVSKDGQQLGTGAYLMHADITSMGDQVTKNSAGESIVVKSGKTEYLKRFGYVRR
ncbi:MAG: von Willebrand factor type domain [Fibrobacteres bacterium]|nr:von Willebrand factor type domain [Fibrobacterota bacterium]